MKSLVQFINESITKFSVSTDGLKLMLSELKDDNKGDNEKLKIINFISKNIKGKELDIEGLDNTNEDNYQDNLNAHGRFVYSLADCMNNDKSNVIIVIYDADEKQIAFLSSVGTILIDASENESYITPYKVFKFDKNKADETVDDFSDRFYTTTRATISDNMSLTNNMDDLLEETDNYDSWFELLTLYVSDVTVYNAVKY